MRVSFLWAIVVGVGAVAACGSTVTGNSPSGQGCPTGQVYCSGCGGGGFCASSTCPAFSCPAPADGGGSDANTPAACPSGQTACTDCGGGTLCVSAGCGAILCPSLDASAGEGGGDLVDGPLPCHTNADCTSPFAFICNPGGGIVGCGVGPVPPPFPCNVDSDCQLIDGAVPPKPMICGQPGGCASGQSCIPGCQSDSDCAGGDSLCRSGHCVAKPCQIDSDCPSIDIYDFTCSSNSGTRVCTYKGCASDSDCHGGFCVNKACSSLQGFCTSSAV